VKELLGGLGGVLALGEGHLGQDGGGQDQGQGEGGEGSHKNSPGYLKGSMIPPGVVLGGGLGLGFLSGGGLGGVGRAGCRSRRSRGWASCPSLGACAPGCARRSSRARA